MPHEPHIPGRKLPLPPSPGATWAALFFLGWEHTWAQGFSSLCSGCAFPGPLVWLTVSLFPNITAQWPFLTSRGAEHAGCPLYPPHSMSPLPTLSFPLHLAPHSILHTSVSLLMVHLPPTMRACLCAQLLGPQQEEQKSTLKVAEWVNKHLPATWGEVDFQPLQSESRACPINHSTILRPRRPGIRSKILGPNPPGGNDEQHLTNEDHGMPG